MPIYEYQCPDCQHRFDVLQKVNDAPVELCPECNKSSVVRLVSAAGFQLKGTGWYATDFKNKGAPSPAASTSSESSASSDTEKKPAAKDKGESA